MATRRALLAGLLAAGLAPRSGWADVGSPAYLTAAMRPDGTYTLCGLTPEGEITFEVPLPARGHAAAAHPTAPIAVAFARRPERFAMVIDCRSGAVLAQIESPEGRHFYGHGAFSSDGSVLYTTENDFEAARGVIGLWDMAGAPHRIGEVSSGGVGPHDLKRLPGREDLVVANGGIETHPDTGRAKLNLAVMRPNLSYVASDGTLLDQVEPDPALHQNSIRHLDVALSGEVAFAMQWQGDNGRHPPLLGLHRRGETARWLTAPGPIQASMRGYAGSVAFSQGDTTVAITSPQGGTVHQFGVENGRFLGALASADVCGLSRGTSTAFHLTAGTGAVGAWNGGNSWRPSNHPRAFDNHLIHV